MTSFRLSDNNKWGQITPSFTFTLKSVPVLFVHFGNTVQLVQVRLALFQCSYVQGSGAGTEDLG